MTDTTALLQERTERLNRTIALESTDRAPVILLADAYFAAHIGAPLSRMAASMEESNKITVEALLDFPEVDGVEFTFAAAKLFPLAFMSEVKMPGKDLPENTVWQIHEREVMTIEDYDTILKVGWNAFKGDYLTNRLKIDLPALFEELSGVPRWNQRVEDQGKVVYTCLAPCTVNEHLTGGRSLAKFMMDLKRMPDKVQEVLDVIQTDSMQMLRHQIQHTGPKIVFLSPARGASEFFAPKLWERFVWKYIKQTAEVIIEEGGIVNFHLDSNWTRDLEFFKAFPAKKCVFEIDEKTDIYKAKELLGDRMAIKGNVPAAMLTLGHPDEVYTYCTKLIKDMGTGFILGAGCGIPYNAKDENVKAMISAATGQ